MSKSMTQTMTYPSTTIAAVTELLADAEFREAVADRQKAVRSSASVDCTGTARTVRIEIAHGTERLPSFARKLVGDEIRLVQEESWTSESHADVRVTIPGKPGDMTGTIVLAQVGDDVVETVDLTVKVGIPLVGGKIEDLISGLLSKAFRVENEIGRTWLARESGA